MEMDPKRKLRISKQISYYLRHHLGALHCQVTPDGYVPLTALLNAKDMRKMQATKEEVFHVVETCPKQRFSIKEESENSEDNIWIRANQGHSIQSATEAGIETEAIYELITEPLPYCAHGTTREAWEKIQTSGLKKMNRTHIHFAQSPEAKSGFRWSSKVLVHIDMAKAMAAGIKFYMSDNNVILSDGIDGHIGPEFIVNVEFV